MSEPQIKLIFGLTVIFQGIHLICLISGSDFLCCTVLVCKSQKKQIKKVWIIENSIYYIYIIIKLGCVFCSDCLAGPTSMFFDKL